jgi:large subunit ribosomal protein L10
MTREEKAQIIEGLSQKFADNAHFYVTDANGFTVEQINNFQKNVFQERR